jgi:FG-GAP repeat/Fibronectin type III domain/FG-GAP-like repeat
MSRTRTTLRLASLSWVVTLLGALAGCGDDTPARIDSGSGGAGGAGGSGGVVSDGGPDKGKGGSGGGGGGTGGGADASPEVKPDAGDAGDAGMDVPPDTSKPCYTVAFTAPVSGAMFTAADDKNADNCADGFQLDVHVTTSAPDGAAVSLYAGTALVKSATASGGAVTFVDVQPASSGTTQLSVQFPGRDACTDATTKASISVDCHVPACTISKPTISPSHPALNGVAAPAGDRASGPGSNYQAAFEVTTDIEDGQLVSLRVSPPTPASPFVVTAPASGGKATFTGVTMVPDASYNVRASCPARSGVIGQSLSGIYLVDTTAPDLAVQSPTDGQFILGATFQVCGSTTATDATALGAEFGAAAANLCAIVGNTPTCVPVAQTGVSTCVTVPCNGGAPFDITVQLSDAAGNPTTKTVSSVACASALPSIQIVYPVSDAPSFADPTQRLLAASASQAFRDQNAASSGAQTDVIACTNRAGTAHLFVGHAGDADAALTQVPGSATTTAATALDGCPAGFGYVVKFPGVTVFESVENADGSLASNGATRLKVDLTDVSTAHNLSPAADFWVDSTAPVLSLLSPTGLCGSFHQASATYTTVVQLMSDTAGVTLTVTNGGSTATLNNPSFISGVATFTSVSFALGSNTMTAVAADPAGNTTALQPIPCPVTVGAAPAVTFKAPAPGQQLCAAGSASAICINDANAGVSGWQGSLIANVTGGGSAITSGSVAFSIGATSLGSAPLDSNGNAQLDNVTLSDGFVTLTATSDDVPGRGVGTGSVTVLVDTGPPSAPTGLTATLLNRRNTSYQLAWTAPSDNGSPVAGYQIRYATVPINSGNFDDPTVPSVTYTGSPANPGAADGIAATNLYIETGYYFAVAAVDAAGNRGPIASTASPVIAHFNVSLIPSPTGTNQLFGSSIDGSADVNGDGVSDLLVGTSNNGHAYLFFGATNFAPTVPAVTFSGVNTSFGNNIRAVGDIDKDGLPDVAISDATGVRVFVFKGRSPWPLTLSDTEADYVITTDATWASSQFGSSMAALGDFDGDGVDDFVIGAPNFSTRTGRVAVIYGRAGFTSFGLPDTTRSLEIGGETGLVQSLFGFGVIGIGHSYSVTTGTTLVVSATGFGNSASASSNEGRLYAFHGRGPGAALNATAADNMRVGPGKGARIGQTLSNLGPIINTLPAVGSGNTGDTLSVAGQSGTAFVLSGSATAGPLNDLLTLYQQGATLFGQVVLGGGFSGRDGAVSLIGSGGPDIALTAQQMATLDIIDGAKLATLTSPANTKIVGDVHLSMPSGWLGTAPGGANLIRDINGDGYPDIALGDVFGLVPGRVAVFW